MSNMTIERIGQFLKSGDTESVIQGGNQIQMPEAPEVGGSGNSAGVKSFGEMLNKTLEGQNDLQLQADRAVNELNAGRNKNIHETMLMLEKADMSFKLMMQVRNKVIDAYHEIMRMQV